MINDIIYLYAYRLPKLPNIENSDVHILYFKMKNRYLLTLSHCVIYSTIVFLENFELFHHICNPWTIWLLHKQRFQICSDAMQSTKTKSENYIKETNHISVANDCQNIIKFIIFIDISSVWKKAQQTRKNRPRYLKSHNFVDLSEQTKWKNTIWNIRKK